LAQVVRFDPPSAAEHCQGGGVVDAVHATSAAVH
jgi:hypothetical protein